MTIKMIKKFDKELFLDAAQMVERFDNAVKRHQNDASMQRQSVYLRNEALELVLDYLMDYGGKNVLQSYAQKLEFSHLLPIKANKKVYNPIFVSHIVEMIWRFNDGVLMYSKSQDHSDFAMNQYQKLRDERVNFLLDYFVELGWQDALESYCQKILVPVLA